MAEHDDFSGLWRSCYWYRSSVRDGEFTSEYYVNVHQKGNDLIIESLPNPEDSYIFIKLSVDGRLATGTWQEQTSPHHFHEGITYHGAVQFVISEDKKRMEGKWVSAGRAMVVNTGAWELERLGHKAAKEVQKKHQEQKAA